LSNNKNEKKYPQSKSNNFYIFVPATFSVVEKQPCIIPYTLTQKKEYKKLGAMQVVDSDVLQKSKIKIFPSLFFRRWHC